MYTQLVCALKFPEITLNISSGGNEALGRQTASRLFAESFVLVTIRVHCGDLGGQTASKFQIILLRLERNQMSLDTIGVPLLRVRIESKSDQIYQVARQDELHRDLTASSAACFRSAVDGGKGLARTGLSGSK